MKISSFLILFLLYCSSLAASQYIYDNSGRIIGVSYSNGVEIDYKYDSSSNLLEINNSVQIDNSTLIEEMEENSPTETPSITNNKSSGSFSLLMILILGFFIIVRMKLRDYWGSRK